MGRRGIALLVVLVALAIVVAVAATSRGGDSPREKQFRPATSKQFGDDADLMRRLERKKLTTRDSK